MTTRARASFAAVLASLVLAACSGAPSRPMPAVAQVDLPKFMGDWYVIAHIPTYMERNAFDAVESYELAADGRILTTFRYRDGSFTEPVEDMHPVGRARAGTGNAIWDMQFLWPFNAEYVIAHLDAKYRQTIIARSDRDYVWLMAREACMKESDRVANTQRIAAMGYDIAQLRWVPQRNANNQKCPTGTLAH